MIEIKNRLQILKARLLFMVATLCSLLFACSSEKEESFNWTDDAARIEKGRVIAYFPKDSIAESRMLEVVDSLDHGIVSALNHMGGPHEWQVYGNKPITYYFAPGAFFSVTDVRGDIFIPLRRIKNYQAPWMHETMHALLRSKKGNWNELSKIKRYFAMPVWFTEGMAEYLAVKLEETDSIKKFDLMKFGGYSGVDSSCIKMLAQNSALHADIGKPGIPTKLLTDREKYAPLFYTCSCSFTKFLVEKYGLNNMITAASEFEKEEETIELLTGKELQALKREWVSFLESR